MAGEPEWRSEAHRLEHGIPLSGPFWNTSGRSRREIRRAAAPACGDNGVMSEQNEPAVPFEAGLEQLEQIVKQMESGELPLERALELFERGMRLGDQCRKQLEEAETRVETLVRRGDKVVPEPFRSEK